MGDRVTTTRAAMDEFGVSRKTLYNMTTRLGIIPRIVKRGRKTPTNGYTEAMMDQLRADLKPVGRPKNKEEVNA
jgi:hypothetical protein